MHTTRLLPLALLLYASTSTLCAQSYPGLNVDNYAGVHGIHLNPANLGSIRTNTEINLASAAVSFYNDYATIDGGNLRQSIREDEFGSAITARSPGDNRMYVNADVIGPSLLLRLGKRTGLALLTRARTVYTAEGVNGYLLEGLYHNFDQLPDFTADQNGYHSTLHSWGEAALALGTTVLHHPNHRVKVGLTLKYLQGLGAVYTSGSTLSAEYRRQQERLLVGGDITFGRTDGYYLDELDPANRSGGFGYDAGLVYEWHPGSAQDEYRDRYRVKVAVSLVDLGNIAYTATATDYQLSGSIPADEVEGGDLEYVLSDYYDGTERSEEATVGLPSALHALVDLRLTGSLYLSGLLTTSARDADTPRSSTVPNTLTIAPRIEGRGFGLYLPYTMRADADNHLGAGLRLGILTLGSGSILSHLLGDGSTTVDAFVGLKFPFHRKAAKAKGGVAGAE